MLMAPHLKTCQTPAQRVSVVTGRSGVRGGTVHTPTAPSLYGTTAALTVTVCVFVYPFTLIYMINSVMIALISQLIESLCRVYSQAVCMAMWNIRMVRSSQTPAITAAVACA